MKPDRQFKYFIPKAALPPAAKSESAARAAVSRADLWTVVDVARRFYTLSQGRLDSERFTDCQSQLGMLLAELPRE